MDAYPRILLSASLEKKNGVLPRGKEDNMAIVEQSQIQLPTDLLDQLACLTAALKEVMEQRWCLLQRRQSLLVEQHSIFEQQQILAEQQSALRDQQSALLLQLASLRIGV